MIKFINVHKAFGLKKVLNGISFGVEKSQVLFVLGTSGTGKSVLLKNLVGLMRPDSGEIWFDGKEISKLREEEYQEVRSQCGLVFQQPALFDSLSIYENVAFGIKRHLKLNGDETQKRVKESLASVGLFNIENKRVSEISYGMQKRVSMARTVALRPKALLFDEPTTGLDPITTSAVNNLIQKLSREYHTTSIVVSHDMRCALEIADKIIVLSQGQVVDQGSPQQLMQSQVPLTQDFLQEIKSEVSI